MKLVSIVIPTNKLSLIWKPLLACIAQQSYSNIEVVLCIDRAIISREFDQISKEVHAILDGTGVQISLITTHNTTFVAGRGASYVRNYAVDVAMGEYVQYMDDDGVREKDYLWCMIERYKSIHTDIWTDFIASPTIMYRDTDKIQSQWFECIWRGICWPQPHHATDLKSLLVSKIVGQKFKYDLPLVNFWVSCIWAMWLFAPRALFQVIRFDEQFEFVYEDLDMTLRASHAWVPVIVFSDISIQHMEAPRTLAQRSYVGSPQMVYYKSRNRIFFIRNNAPLWWKVLFYCFGLWLHLIWFNVMILLYWTKKFESWLMLWKGTWDGLLCYKVRNGQNLNGNKK